MTLPSLPVELACVLVLAIVCGCCMYGARLNYDATLAAREAAKAQPTVFVLVRELPGDWVLRGSHFTIEGEELS